MTVISNRIGRAGQWMVFVPLEHGAPPLEPRALPVVVLLVLAMMVVPPLVRRLWLRWRRWQARRRRPAGWACPVCRHHLDAAFIDCRAGDCVVDAPHSWRPEEESYV